MPELYSLAYLSPKMRRRSENQNECASAFYAAVRDGDFPYDIGDDPAFFSASYYGGPVTWGVCRPDVRSAISPGDWVIFFAAAEPEAYEPGARNYRFVAALQVQLKMRHIDLFKADVPYQNYLNLLVRPVPGGWQHHEPALHSRDWHKDWLWRVAKTGRRRKEHMSETRDRPIPEETVRNALADPPANYVIFDSENAIRARVPIPVAEYRKGDEQERWFGDERTQRIKSLIYLHNCRGLRTLNIQQPHRHFRRHLPDPNWAQQFSEAIQF
jgi:hypothetical protein